MGEGGCSRTGGGKLGWERGGLEQRVRTLYEAARGKTIWSQTLLIPQRQHRRRGKWWEGIEDDGDWTLGGEGLDMRGGGTVGLLQFYVAAFLCVAILVPCRLPLLHLIVSPVPLLQVSDDEVVEVP